MSFFTDGAYFTGPALTEEAVLNAERRLGVRLPPAYIALLRQRNGGEPIRRCFPMMTPSSWASDHIAIAAILGIGGRWGIDGADGSGSAYWIREWGYPDIGVVICATPSGGHDTVMLDYSESGPNGEPRVVYVDEDRIPVVIASNFQEFVAGLLECPSYDP